MEFPCSLPAAPEQIEVNERWERCMAARAPGCGHMVQPPAPPSVLLLGPRCQEKCALQRPAQQHKLKLLWVVSQHFSLCIARAPSLRFFLVTGSLSMVKPVGSLSGLWAAFSCLISRNSRHSCSSIPRQTVVSSPVTQLFFFSLPTSSSLCFLPALAPFGYILWSPSLPSINIITKLLK